MIFVINERMPYSHSHRVAWPRPKAGDSVLLTFDFRSSRRGGRHHVRLEYQLPIRSENGTTSRSYSVIPLKVTHYYFSAKHDIRPPTPPPARRSLRPSDHMFFSARVFSSQRLPLIVTELQLVFFTHRWHVHRHHTWETYTRGDTSADVYPVQHCGCTYTRTRVCILPVCFTLAMNGTIIVSHCSITCTDLGDFFFSHAT